MTSNYQYHLPGFPEQFKKPRRGMKDVFHASFTRSVEFDPIFEMPTMCPESQIPSGLISFSEAMGSYISDFDQYVHFYENDCRIERFWNAPWKYMDRLAKFAGKVTCKNSRPPEKAAVSPC